MKKRSLHLIAVSVMMLLMTGCIYDWVVPEEVPDIPVGVEISFADQIVPIFTSGNNCTSCHRAGATPPDLTAANAYTQINTAKYLNRSAPAESGIYKVPAPGSSTHRHKIYTAQQAALILAWIEQGAKNN
jgi:hypothetical protein